VSAGYGAVHCYAPKPWGPAAEDRFVGHLIEKAVAQQKSPLALLPPWVNAVTQMDCWWIDPIYEQTTDGDKCQPRAHGIFPQITMLENLDHAFPGGKFILNTRDARQWLKSVKAYGPLQQILIEADLPGLPAGKGGEDEDLVLWFEDHVNRVRKYFSGRDDGSFTEFALEEGNEVIKKRLDSFLGVDLEWGCHNVTTWWDEVA